MAIAEQSYIGDGATKVFPFAFPYISTSDVKATVDTSPVAITLPTASSVEFGVAPGLGAKIRIYRETPAGTIAATFFPGASIRAQDLNNGFKQLLYTLQEVVERSVLKIDTVLVGALNMSGFKVTNLGIPTTSSDAATKGYIDAQVANIEFLANSANSLNNDGYPELRRVFGNSQGLTAANWHNEVGRMGYTHTNSGNSEGQFIVLKGVANALLQSQDSRFSWLLQLLVKPLISVLYRGIDAPTDVSTINKNNLWIPHWLWNTKGDFVGEEIKYDLTLSFVNGQANIPVEQYGDKVRTVYKVVSPDTVLEWVNPFAALKSGTNYAISNYTTSSTGTLIQLQNSFTGSAKVIYSSFTGPVIGKNQPYEGWPCWRQLDIGETACAVDALAWAAQAYDLAYKATRLPVFKRYYNATLEASKYVFRIDDDTYWLAPDLTTEFTLPPYSTYLSRAYNELSRTREGNQYLDLPVGTANTEITVNKHIPVNDVLSTFQTGQELNVEAKSSTDFQLLVWIDTTEEGFDLTKRYYAGRTFTPTAGDFALAPLQTFTLIPSDFRRADDGTTQWPGDTTVIKRVGYTIGQPEKAGLVEIKEIRLKVDSGHPYCPGLIPFVANTRYERLITWRGPIYTGYQDPWMWHIMGDTVARDNCLAYITAAQNDYTSRLGIVGPFSPIFYLNRPDNIEYGVPGTFGWNGPDPSTSWGGFQYRVAYNLAHLLLEDPTITAASTPLNLFLEFSNNEWPDATPIGGCRWWFPANAAPSTTYTDIYFLALLGCAALYAKVKNIGVAQTNTDLVRKSLKALDQLYTVNQWGGDRRGAFMPDVADTNYYAFHHGEVLFFLGEVLRLLPSGDYASLNTTKTRIQEMCFNAGGWAERNMR